jgi:hypothetical protein
MGWSSEAVQRLELLRAGHPVEVVELTVLESGPAGTAEQKVDHVAGNLAMPDRREWGTGSPRDEPGIHGRAGAPVAPEQGCNNIRRLSDIQKSLSVLSVVFPLPKS